MLFMILIPGVIAKNIDIEDIPITVKWSITKDGDKMVWVNISVWSDDDQDDFVFTKNITNQTSDNDDDFEIAIRRNLDVLCEEQDIGNLTRALIDSNRAVASTINNSFNFPKEYSDCLEGRAKIAESNKVYLQERDKFKNDSSLYQGLYKDEQDTKDQVKTRLDTCNSDLLTRNTDYNTCTTDLEKSKKKPSQYAMISIVITLIVVNIYNKSKEPKPPEVFQFSGR